MNVGDTQAIRLVVDTSSNVPREIQAEHNMIEVNTLVLFGSDQYELNKDIDIDQFLTLLDTRPEHPTTSQPSPRQFQDAYAQAFDEGADQVLCLVVSAQLSGTYNSAVLAAREFPEGAVKVWDTKGASISSGLQAIMAGQLLRRHMSRDQIVGRLEEVRDSTAAFFTTKDLEYLARSGRVSNMQKNIGSMLSLVPILSVRDGLVVPVARVRGRVKAKRELLNRVADQLDAGPCVVAVTHAEVEAEAQELLAAAKARLDVRDSYLIRLDPALTALGGPGTLGMAGQHAIR